MTSKNRHKALQPVQGDVYPLIIQQFAFENGPKDTVVDVPIKVH